MDNIEIAIETVNELLTPKDLISICIEAGNVVELLGVIRDTDEDLLLDMIVSQYSPGDFWSLSELSEWFNDNCVIADFFDIEGEIDKYIGNHSPEEVYGTDFMSTYVMENYSHEIIDNSWEGILEQVKEVYNPEDVFEKDNLEAWAEQNGYVKEEK